MPWTSRCTSSSCSARAVANVRSGSDSDSSRARASFQSCPVRRNDTPPVQKPGVRSRRATHRYGSSLYVPHGSGRAPARSARCAERGEVGRLLRRSARPRTRRAWRGRPRARHRPRREAGRGDARPRGRTSPRSGARPAAGASRRPRLGPGPGSTWRGAGARADRSRARASCATPPEARGSTRPSAARRPGGPPGSAARRGRRRAARRRGAPRPWSARRSLRRRSALSGGRAFVAASALSASVEAARLLERADPVLDRARILGEGVGARLPHRQRIRRLRVRVRPAHLLVEKTALLVGEKTAPRPRRRAEGERDLAVGDSPARRLRPGGGSFRLRPSLERFERAGQVAQLTARLREVALGRGIGQGFESGLELRGGGRVVDATAVDLREARGHREQPIRLRQVLPRDVGRRPHAHRRERDEQQPLHGSTRSGRRAKPRFLAPSTASKKSSCASLHRRGHAHDAHGATSLGVPAQGNRRALAEADGEQEDVLVRPHRNPQGVAGSRRRRRLRKDSRGAAVEHEGLRLRHVGAARVAQDETHRVSSVRQPLGDEEASLPRRRARAAHERQAKPERKERRHRTRQGIAFHPQHGIAGLYAPRTQERARGREERGVGCDELVTLRQGDDLVHPLPLLALGLDPKEQVVDPGAGPPAGEVAGLEGALGKRPVQASILY